MSELVIFKTIRTSLWKSVTNYIKKIESIIAEDEINVIELYKISNR